MSDCWSLFDRAVASLGGKAIVTLKYLPFGLNGWHCAISWEPPNVVEAHGADRETAVWLAAARVFELRRPDTALWQWYSVWTHDCPEGGITFKDGLAAPHGVNGSLLFPINKVEYLIQANTAEEASQIRHHRQGWEPYIPLE